MFMSIMLHFTSPCDHQDHSDMALWLYSNVDGQTIMGLFWKDIKDGTFTWSSL